MVAAPNFIAGLMIGIGNDSWFAVIIVCFVWSLIFCVYVAVFDTRRKTATIVQFESTGRAPILGHVTYSGLLFRRV
jgi:hypothetical protein